MVDVSLLFGNGIVIQFVWNTLRYWQRSVSVKMAEAASLTQSRRTRSVYEGQLSCCAGMKIGVGTRGGEESTLTLQYLSGIHIRNICFSTSLPIPTPVEHSFEGYELDVRDDRILLGTFRTPAAGSNMISIHFPNLALR